MSDRISGGIVRDSSAIVSSGISGGVRKIDLLAGQRITGATIFAAPYVSGGAGVTDHGALTGLSDDDHLQYLTQARGDTRLLQFFPLLTPEDLTPRKVIAQRDAEGRPTRVDYLSSPGGALLRRKNINRDALNDGRITSEVILGADGSTVLRTRTFTYDENGRISEVNG